MTYRIASQNRIAIFFCITSHRNILSQEFPYRNNSSTYLPNLMLIGINIFDLEQVGFALIQENIHFLAIWSKI